MVSELNAKVIMNWEDSTFGSIGGTRCTVYSNEFNSNLAAWFLWLSDEKRRIGLTNRAVGAKVEGKRANGRQRPT